MPPVCSRGKMRRDGRECERRTDARRDGAIRLLGRKSERDLAGAGAGEGGMRYRGRSRAALTGLSPPAGPPRGLLKSHCDPDPPLGRRESDARSELAAFAAPGSKRSRARVVSLAREPGPAGDGAPFAGASDRRGIGRRDRRCHHIAKASFAGSESALTSRRVTTGRHGPGGRIDGVLTRILSLAGIVWPTPYAGSGPPRLFRSRPTRSRRRYANVGRC